jgi:hypothetical protein
MVSIDDIIAAATLREETATVCVAGDLNAQHETAEKALRALGDWVPVKMGDEDPRTALAAEVTDLERRMAAHEHAFRFRSLPWKAFRRLRQQHTPDSGILDSEAFVPALILACAVDPAFTDLAQVEQLLDVLSEGQVDRLFTAAWVANVGSADIPKSVLASARMATSAPR